MTVKIELLTHPMTKGWDQYVYSGSRGNLYLLSGWKNIIEETYKHNTYYLYAVDQKKGTFVGVLPLVHLNHFLFGNSLVSMPYADMGGVLGDNERIESQLITKAVNIGKSLNAKTVELRHCEAKNSIQGVQRNTGFHHYRQSRKVRMLLDLPSSSSELMNSFKSKLRSQIKKPIKEGLYSFVGGMELIDDFYKVFSNNMRDLGSPVHSRKLFRKVLTEFKSKAGIVVVKKNETPVAASIICGFKDVLENPWASSLHKYSRLSPNMLLYWTMLEYACDCGYRYFDFGRSTPNEGTFNFKKQWGAFPEHLFWDYVSEKSTDNFTGEPEKSKFSGAIHIWRKIPVKLTVAIGPMIRKHIGL